MITIPRQTRDERKIICQELKKMAHFYTQLANKSEYAWDVIPDLATMQKHYVGYYTSRTGKKTASWNQFLKYIAEQEAR